MVGVQGKIVLTNINRSLAVVGIHEEKFLVLEANEIERVPRLAADNAETVRQGEEFLNIRRVDRIESITTQSDGNQKENTPPVSVFTLHIYRTLFNQIGQIYGATIICDVAEYIFQKIILFRSLLKCTPSGSLNTDQLLKSVQGRVSTCTHCIMKDIDAGPNQSPGLRPCF